MEFPERVSEKLTGLIAAELGNIPEQKLAEINYGIAVFITNSYKMLLLFILAAFLNVFKYFVIAFMSFGALRTFASGVHAKREWTCLPASTILFFGTVYAGLSLSLNLYIITIIFALCFVAMLRYAPADTEEKPIVSKKLRKKLKIMSCITIVALYIAAAYTLGTPASTIIAFSSLIETMLILPVTYKLAGSIYNAGINISSKKEV